MALENTVDIRLNIYDLVLDGRPLKKLNDVAIPLGFGAFHSGIEIFGKEVSFSQSEGIFLAPPKNCWGADFRKSVVLGEARITRSEFKAQLIHLMTEWNTQTYDIFDLNCNHFCAKLAEVLLGKPSPDIPSWLNKLSRFLKFISSGQESLLNADVNRPEDHPGHDEQLMNWLRMDEFDFLSDFSSGPSSWEDDMGLNDCDFFGINRPKSPQPELEITFKGAGGVDACTISITGDDLRGEVFQALGLDEHTEALQQLGFDSSCPSSLFRQVPQMKKPDFQSNRTQPNDVSGVETEALFKKKGTSSPSTPSAASTPIPIPSSPAEYDYSFGGQNEEIQIIFKKSTNFNPENPVEAMFKNNVPGGGIFDHVEIFTKKANQDWEPELFVKKPGTSEQKKIEDMFKTKAGSPQPVSPSPEIDIFIKKPETAEQFFFNPPPTSKRRSSFSRQRSADDGDLPHEGLSVTRKKIQRRVSADKPPDRLTQQREREPSPEA